MFFGTTPSIISQWVKSELDRHKPKRVYEPFAGNFVVSQLCGLSDKSIRVISTDVSLYSSAIGFGLCNQVSSIGYQDEVKEQFPYFFERNDPFGLGVGVIFFSEVAGNLAKSHIKYYAVLNHSAMTEQEHYYAQIEKKLNAFKSNLGDFTFLGIDGVKVANEAGEGDLVFYDPPVLLGDYEKMFAPLKKIFKFEEPEYTEMNDYVKEQQLQDLNERGCKVYYRTNNPLPEPPKGYELVFKHQYKHGAFYCVYSNTVAQRFVGRFNPLNEQVKNLPIISEKDTITEDSTIEVFPVQGNVANHFRLMWVKKAEMKNVGTPFLIRIDGKIIGLFQILDATKFGTDLSLIVSDPAAPYSKYERLSKLVINLCCTQETLTTLNNMSMWEHVGFTTLVYSNNPVSMKYRNLFELKERKDHNGFFKFKLIYQNKKKIFATYRDALKAWLKNDGKKINETELYR